MSATEGGRTGRKRIGGEAAPSERQPEDEEPVDQAEAEPSVTDGVYFSKVPSRDVWHAHNEDHDHIGTVYRATDDRWYVKADRRDMPASFGSAVAGRAFLSGFALGMKEGQASSIREGDPVALMRTRTATVAPGAEASTDASHDADA